MLKISYKNMEHNIHNVKSGFDFRKHISYQLVNETFRKHNRIISI